MLRTISNISATNLIISMTLGVGIAAAQDRNCTQALVRDVGYLNLYETSSLALAEWFYRSRDFDKNWAASAEVPIKAGSLGGSAESAERARERYFRSINLNWTHERVESIVTQTLSDNAVRAYEACVNGDKRDGVRILTYKGTEEAATVEIEWTAAAGAPTTANDVSISIEGGTVAEPFPTVWNSGEVKTRIVTRDPDSDIRIAADVGPDSGSTFISRIPKAPKDVWVLKMARCQGGGDLNNMWFWGPAGDTCNGFGRFAWGKYNEDERVVWELGSCTGGGSVAGVTFWGPVGEPCLFSDERWGKYEKVDGIPWEGIASCKAGGDKIGGHRFYGPKGQICGGNLDWEHYLEHPVLINALIPITE